MKNGKTVEVLNTDAEGRLVMADALALGAAAKPDAIIDVATLTGACMIALGNRYSGLMANDEALAAELLEAAAEAGEPTWRLPLPPEYHKDIESDLADLKNVGDRWGGALVAGLFLQEFVDAAPGRTSTSPAPPGPSPRTATSARAQRASPSGRC
jgi:leucyl aminopeptidase